jgi:hypothetical protein
LNDSGGLFERFWAEFGVCAHLAAAGLRWVETEFDAQALKKARGGAAGLRIESRCSRG